MIILYQKKWYFHLWNLQISSWSVIFASCNWKYTILNYDIQLEIPALPYNIYCWYFYNNQSLYSICLTVWRRCGWAKSLNFCTSIFKQKILIYHKIYGKKILKKKLNLLPLVRKLLRQNARRSVFGYLILNMKFLMFLRIISFTL